MALVIGILGFAGRADATIIASESFDYTASTALGGQGSTGSGFTGSWAATNTATASFNVAASGLSMAGVASSGNAAIFTLAPAATGTSINYATRLFSSSLPATQTVYGGFLFNFNNRSTNNNAIGGVLIGNATDTDGTSSFAYEMDAYGTQSSQFRAEGVQATTGTQAATQGNTFLCLFQMDAATGNTMGWILSESQYANASGSLNATYLNSLTTNTTAATGILYRANVTAVAAVGDMSALRLLGYTNGTVGASDYVFTLDEMRFSDSSLLEVAAVPEPSSFLLLGFGLIALFYLRQSKKSVLPR